MITIALPVYASPIAWLAMESLCNQVTDVAWELIIYEDEEQPNGKDFYKSYSKNLVRAGCTRMLYLYSKRRIPLSFKWKEMAEKANDKSIGVLLQGADNYSEPLRIRKAHEILSQGYDWIYTPTSLFYHIHKKKYILYESKDIGIGADMAIKKELAQQLPDEVKWSSVDSWIFNNLKKIKPDAKIFQDLSENWRNGLATDGENRISLQRKKMFDNPVYPFYFTEIKSNLPIEIWNKLKEL